MSTNPNFINLISSHEGMLYKIASLYTNSREDKSDLYQEIVFQLYKSFDTFQGKSKRSTWMYRIALNTAITHLKKAKRQLQTTAFSSQMTEVMERFEEDHYEEQRSYLYAQIKALNIVDRGIILLYLEGSSYEEIATITGFTKSNVGTKLNRIKDKIKRNIKTSYDGIR